MSSASIRCSELIKMTLACSQCLLILGRVNVYISLARRANEKEENDAHHFLLALRSILIGYWPATESWKMNVVTS